MLSNAALSDSAISDAEIYIFPTPVLPIKIFISGTITIDLTIHIPQLVSPITICGQVLLEKLL